MPSRLQPTKTTSLSLHHDRALEREVTQQVMNDQRTPCPVTSPGRSCSCRCSASMNFPSTENGAKANGLFTSTATPASTAKVRVVGRGGAGSQVRRMSAQPKSTNETSIHESSTSASVDSQAVRLPGRGGAGSRPRVFNASTARSNESSFEFKALASLKKAKKLIKAFPLHLPKAKDHIPTHSHSSSYASERGRWSAYSLDEYAGFPPESPVTPTTPVSPLSPTFSSFSDPTRLLSLYSYSLPGSRSNLSANYTVDVADTDFTPSMLYLPSMTSSFTLAERSVQEDSEVLENTLSPVESLGSTVKTSPLVVERNKVEPPYISVSHVPDSNAGYDEYSYHEVSNGEWSATDIENVRMKLRLL